MDSINIHKLKKHSNLTFVLHRRHIVQDQGIACSGYDKCFFPGVHTAILILYSYRKIVAVFVPLVTTALLRLGQSFIVASFSTLIINLKDIQASLSCEKVSPYQEYNSFYRKTSVCRHIHLLFFISYISFALKQTLKFLGCVPHLGNIVGQVIQKICLFNQKFLL